MHAVSFIFIVINENIFHYIFVIVFINSNIFDPW